MFGIMLSNRMTNRLIQQLTKIVDVMESNIEAVKRSWAGHLGRRTDECLTKKDTRRLID